MGLRQRISYRSSLIKDLDEANEKGWTVVDMKNDWKDIYPYEIKVKFKL